jgi:hypothetical protein
MSTRMRTNLTLGLSGEHARHRTSHRIVHVLGTVIGMSWAGIAYALALVGLLWPAIAIGTAGLVVFFLAWRQEL